MQVWLERKSVRNYRTKNLHLQEYTMRYLTLLKRSLCISGIALVSQRENLLNNLVNRLGTKNKFGDEKLDMEV